MSLMWTGIPPNHYVSLVPWCWMQLENAVPPRPFPFIDNVAPEVVASLQEAHGLLASAIDTAISDVFSKRAPLDDLDRGDFVGAALDDQLAPRPCTRARSSDASWAWTSLLGPGCLFLPVQEAE